MDYNIKSYGAIGDGVYVNTKKQDRISNCRSCILYILLDCTTWLTRMKKLQ